jgi:protein TonB
VAALVGADSATPIPISPDPLLQSLVASGPGPAGGGSSPTPTLHTRLFGLAGPRPARRRWALAVAASLALALATSAWMAFSPSREAAAPGPLRVETQPAGMGVWIDGRHAGRAPLDVPLAPGTHQLRISEPGYAPAELSLQLSPGTTAAPLRFVMAPLSRATPEPAPSVKVAAAQPEPRPRAAAPRPQPIPATREGDLVPLSDAVQPPRRISGRMPEYPKAARRLGLSGSVLIETTVTERGEAEQIHVLESAGAILDESVIEAVSTWRFEPAVRDGVKVRVRWPYRQTFTTR